MNPKPPQRSFISLALITALIAYAWWQTRPFLQEGALVWVSHGIGAIAGIYGIEVLCRALLLIAFVLDWIAAATPTGKDGTSSFATFPEFSSELVREKSGPFWGRTLDSSPKPIFSDYVSNAMTVAPAGSGKGICTVIPMAMSIRASKVFVDFKGEQSCMLMRPLQDLGETVYVINPFQLFTDIIGYGESLNPLDIVTDDFNRPSGIRDVYPDSFELAFQAYPEPESGKSDNTYWRDGGRDLVIDFSIFEVIIEGYEASLAKVAHTLQDRKELELTLRWVVGVDMNGKPLESGPMPIEQCDWVKYHDPADVAEFCKTFRARMASHLALMNSADSRTFDSFLSGAQKTMAPIGFPRIASVIGKSTFDPNELKNADRPVTIFIVPDSSRPEASERWLAIVLWLLLTTWKRHPDKKRPVYHIFDEATNYTVPKVGELATWGRGSGIRMHLIFQDLNAFEKKYSKETLETLLSETEIKQFLPGQRSPRTLELISKQLGNQSVIASNYGNGGVDKGMQWNTSEVGRPLMLADEIRRTNAGILFLRRCKPVLFEPISYAEVCPWRDQVSPNPYHGNKPFKKKVKVKL